jgi:pre-mycofactocin synthase
MEGCRYENAIARGLLLPRSTGVRHEGTADTKRVHLMGNGWFESVAEAQRRARKRLPKSVYGALIAGTEQGLTVADNIAAFSELGFAPHVAGLPAHTMARHAPEALARPRWLTAFARTGRLPSLTVPNMAAPGGPAPAFFGAYGEWMQTPPPAWEEVRWLREQWDSPFMLKGITRIDDARRAADAGVTAISVSNHGGNNLDGTPAAIRALPAVADAVGEHIEVVLDGGIRRGSDVVKALALGARAVMIGRAYLWGLAANGQAGVAHVLDILRAGLDSALLALGRASVHDLTPDDPVIPAGFTRALDTSAPDIKVT